jgi:uncharacterized membrane protein YdjX (TVP38/TMEM64 family)
MTATTTHWRYLRIGLGAAVLLAIMYFVWSAYDHQAVMAWFQDLRPVPFVIAMALLPAIGAPTTPLYILAGASFGIWVGLLVSLIGLAANATLCFWIARKMRPRFERLLERFETELPDFSERRGGGLRFVLGVKVAPGPPAFVKNYGLGISGVSYRTFMLVTMLFTGIYAGAFVVIGESLLDHRPSHAVIAIGVLAALIALVVWYRRRKQRRVGPRGRLLETQTA